MESGLAARRLNSGAHSGIVHSGREAGASPTSTDGWADEGNAVRPYHRFTQGGDSEAGDDVSEP